MPDFNNGMALKIEDAKKEIIKTVKEGRDKPKWWEVLTILLPIVLGFFVWNAQASIQKDLDDQSKNLTTRLSLTEEFYKRQLTVHEKIYDKMSILLEILRQERLRKKGPRQEFNKAIREFYDSYNIPKLYVSPELKTELGGLWSEIATPSEPSEVNESAVKQRIEAIATQMSRDLHVEEISRASRTLWE